MANQAMANAMLLTPPPSASTTSSQGSPRFDNSRRGSRAAMLVDDVYVAPLWKTKSPTPTTPTTTEKATTTTTTDKTNNTTAEAASPYANYATYPSRRNKTVLITGGASGIGAAAVELFCRQGSRVIFLDSDKTSAASLLQRLGSLGPSATPILPTFMYCHVGDVVLLRDCADRALRAFGPVDVLINNAARPEAERRVPTPAVTPESFNTDVSMSLRHQFFLTQAVVPAMRAAGRGGSVINMGSIAWRVPALGCPVYTACKAAVVGLTRTHAREFGRYGVRVNSILPGAVATKGEGDDILANPACRAELMAVQALQRVIMPDDVARLMLFLAADDSSAITGSNYVVDAGWVGDP